MAGCVIYNVPGTQTILIHSVATSQSNNPQSYNLDGTPDNSSTWKLSNKIGGGNQNNIISCEFDTDITDYFSYIKLIGQTESEELISDGEIKKAMLKTDTMINGYRGLQKFGCHEVTVADAAMWSQSQNALLDNVILQQNRKLYSIKYEVAGHTPNEGGTPWHVNHLANIFDDYLPMYNTDMLVYRVVFNGSKESGSTTELELCQPGAFNPWIGTVQNNLSSLMAPGTYRGYNSLSAQQKIALTTGGI
jgi:hypothetical protein